MGDEEIRAISLRCSSRYPLAVACKMPNLKDATVMCTMQSDCLYFQDVLRDNEECMRLVGEFFDAAGFQYKHELHEDDDEPDEQNHRGELRWRYEQWRAGKIALCGEEVVGRLTTDGLWLLTQKGWLPVGGADLDGDDDDGDCDVLPVGARPYIRSYQVVGTYGKQGADSFGLDGLGVGHLIASYFPWASGGAECPLPNEEYDAFMRRSGRDAHLHDLEDEDLSVFFQAEALYSVLGFYGGYQNNILAYGENPVPGWFTDGRQWFPMSIPRKAMGMKVRLCGIQAIERQPILKPVVSIQAEYVEMAFLDRNWLFLAFFLIPYMFCALMIPSTAVLVHGEVAKDTETGWEAVLPSVYFACSRPVVTASFFAVDVGMGLVEMKMLQAIPGGINWLKANKVDALNCFFFASMGRWKIFTVTTFTLLAYNARDQSRVWMFAVLVWLLGFGSQLALGLYLNVNAMVDGFVDVVELAKLCRFNFLQTFETIAKAIWKGGAAASTATTWKKRVNQLRFCFQDIPMSIAQLIFIVGHSHPGVFPIFALFIGTVSGIHNVRQSMLEDKKRRAPVDTSM